MSTLAIFTILITVAILVALWLRRTLSPNLVLVLAFLFLSGNTEFVLTTLAGELPETLLFVDVADLAYATFLFDTGLLAMSGGMWLHYRFWPRAATSSLRRGADQLADACSGPGALRMYAVLFVGTAVLQALISGPLSPLAQLFLPLLMLRFFPIYILAYRYFKDGSDGSFLLALVAFEIVVNLSYFASFVNLFIVSAASLVLAVRDGARFKVVPATIFLVVMLLVTSTWTYIKSDFRAYLAAGQQAQVDTRSLLEKLDFVGTQLEGFGLRELREGFYNSLLRFAYNGFFAATVRYIPEQADHTDGAHLIASMQAAVMPRFLFPDKPAIDDSEIVRRYTGLTVSGAEQATSISLGQFGELYGDFGAVGMMFALALSGFVLAAFESMFVRRIGPGLDSAALGACFVTTYGTQIYSLPKLIAVLLYTWLAAYLFIRFVYPRLARQLQQRPVPVYMRKARR